MNNNITIRELNKDEQTAARALIHRNCPVAGNLMDYSDDANRIHIFRQNFTAAKIEPPAFHTIVLGAYTSTGELIGALNMNSMLYILENALQNPHQAKSAWRMLWHGAKVSIFIDNIGVNPDYRLQGVGRALIDHALDIAKHRLNLRYIGLASTTAESTAFFQQVGFSLCQEELPASFFGNTFSLQLGSLYTQLGMSYMLKEL